MQNRVFVLDSEQASLMPCVSARARRLLGNGKAAVFRREPFTIILTNRSGGDVQPLAFKVDPGSKQSGVALVAEFPRGKEVIFAAEITHRGQAVKSKLESRSALRRGRRQRNTRYRPARWSNRCRPKGWLPPSLMSRIANVTTWLSRLARSSPVSRVSMELIKFDLQGMDNPEISGVDYQQGSLLGYEVREYLLEKFKRTCVYCGKKNVPLEIEHVIPRSRGGVDSIRNLAIACNRCNKRKGNKTAAEFGHPEVEGKCKATLKDAAAVNASRWALWRKLKDLGLDVECGSGGRTKFNRTKQDYPKAHWIDAACVGVSGEHVTLTPSLVPLTIKATGRSSRQFRRNDAYGFPLRCKDGKFITPRQRARVTLGFQTGDLVRAMKTSGKYIGIHVGRVTMQATGRCAVNGVPCRARELILLQHADGYKYERGAAKQEPDS